MWAFPVARPPDLTQRGQAKVPISHSLHGRSLTACYSSCCYVWVLAGILPGAYQCQGTFPPHTCLPLTYSDNKTKLPASPWKELVHTSRTTTFLWLLRDGTSNHLALKVSGTHHSWVSQDYVKQNKTEVLEWAAFPTVIPSRLSTEGADKNTHLSVSPWKEFDCIFSQPHAV